MATSIVEIVAADKTTESVTTVAFAMLVVATPAVPFVDGGDEDDDDDEDEDEEDDNDDD